MPGEHGPTGPVTNLSGLTFTAGGKTLPWRRDAVDMYAFHLDVPQGASALDVNLEFLAPSFSGGFTSGSSTTSHLAVLSWNWVLLYLRVTNIDDLMFTASLRLPPGWKFGTGLTADQRSAGEVRFRAASLATLVDSPVLAGEHFRAIPLSTATPPAELDIAADGPAALAASQQFTDAMRKLVDEAKALFGAEHYDHYTFLCTLSDRVAHFGLEHHQSSDTRVAASPPPATTHHSAESSAAAGGSVTTRRGASESRIWKWCASGSTWAIRSACGSVPRASSPT
ncbi:MAG TPA: hypothetical protein VFO16_22135 [Pseudonocardiaceae bacterium]|nr:hypothetical protein [Pseudonocardiaceae bacterium]